MTQKGVPYIKLFSSAGSFASETEVQRHWSSEVRALLHCWVT